MAGGTWIDQNKVRPGVYINYKSAPSSLATMGERGVVAIGWLPTWGVRGKFYTIEGTEDTEKLGYPITAPEMLFIRQILRGTNRTSGASKILVWALESTGSASATATLGNLVATAKYAGTFGNRLSVDIAEVDTDVFKVTTYLDGKSVDAQTVEAITGLSANDYVTWSGSGTLAANTGVALAGGSNGTVASDGYQNFRTALSVQKFDVVIYDGTDAGEKALFAQFVQDQSNNEGNKCQLVVSNYPSADNECVISVYPQAITLLDGTALTAPQLTWWVGGATAGANAYESLTYASHPDAVSVNPSLTSSQQESAINSGQLALIGQFGVIQVLTDINSFRTYSVNKGKPFRKNRVIRTVFGVCNDIYKAFALYYIGAVHNDEDGRKALKAEILNILDRYQGNRALQNVVADDVTVSPGVDVDAVTVETYIQPIDSIEKIYINITIS